MKELNIILEKSTDNLHSVLAFDSEYYIVYKMDLDEVEYFKKEYKDNTGLYFYEYRLINKKWTNHPIDWYEEIFNELGLELEDSDKDEINFKIFEENS